MLVETGVAHTMFMVQLRNGCTYLGLLQDYHYLAVGKA